MRNLKITILPSKKAPASEFIRKVCTEPSRKKKEKALKVGSLSQANLNATQENARRIVENNLKLKKKNTKVSLIYVMLKRLLKRIGLQI